MRIFPILRRGITIPLELPTHAQRVKSLYKRSIRNLEASASDIVDYRIEAVMMRARFDANKAETDVVKIRNLLAEGEKELYENKHPSPIYFPESPGGVAYGREADVPDWLVDYWHPLERARYPVYFARREQRKKEFLLWWEKQYGKPAPGEGHH